MQIHKNEITTGILVLATSALLLAVLVVVGMPGLIRPVNTYRIYFDNANGIRPGAPVLLAGREIGKVTALASPVALEKRPAGHADYEVSIDVQVSRDAAIYRNVTVHLAQQGLMGQQVIDFLHGDADRGLADNHGEFVGERIPDVPEAMNDHLNRLTGPDSDLALTIKNAKTFIETLNNSKIQKVISNTEELTDTLKREPWRILWPSKPLAEDKKPPAVTRKETAREKQVRLHRSTDARAHR
ncbi:MAG: MlaD family protein [Verrucomicrobiae bacterium]